MDFSKAQAEYIERNDIVVQVAKMIDPGAFQEWHRLTATGKEPVKPDTRKKYAQSRAIYLANEILKVASQTPDLKKRLAEAEIAAWEALGIPASDPTLRQTVEAKYA
jgi:hypothetical protein